MQRKIFFFFLCLAISHLGIAQSSTILKGTVTDAVTGETVIGASVTIYKGKILKTGEQTDIDGNFEIHVDPGKYDVCVTYIGYSPVRMTDVAILEKKINLLDVKLYTVENLGQVVVLPFIKPRIEAITSSEIQKVPVRDINVMTSLPYYIDPYDLKRKGNINENAELFARIDRLSNLPPVRVVTPIELPLTGIPASFEDFSDVQF
jgi:CarboxypepD_reg-like domain